MSGGSMKDGFSGVGGSGGAGWPVNGIWEAMDQLRGMFEQKVAAPRMARGDVRAAVLALLAEQPMHGYQIIQQIEERSGGAWKPSPGSVYPTLQLLEEAGFASSSQHDGKRVYAITEAGQAELQAKMAQADGPPPWMDAESASGHDDLRKAVGQLVMAAKQVGMTDNQTHIETAAGVINEARRKLYQLLAEA